MDNLQLNVTVKDAEVILAALSKMPLEVAAEPFFKIKGQAEQQIAAAQVPADKLEDE